MSEYIRKDDILSAAVEVEYLGRPRMMVSVAKIGNIPVIEVVRCKECKWLCVITDEDEGTSYYMCGVWSNATDEDTFCSYGEVKR